MHHSEILGARERMAVQPHLEALAGKYGLSDKQLASATPDNGAGLFGEDGFGFDDFLDLINPLQHIPVVSTAYRALTGDTIEPGARLAGGALFGGPIGLASALANTAFEEATGTDIGESVLALFGGGDDAGGDAPAGNGAPDIMLADDGAERPATIAALQAAASDDGSPVSRADTPPPHSADIPGLSQDQVALLLSSVGLSPEAVNTTTPVVSSASTAQAGAPVATEPARRAAAPTPEPAPVRPVAATNRDEVKPERAVWQPFAAGVDPADMPQEMISEAMAWALDKYESEFGVLNVKPRGQAHDSGA